MENLKTMLARLKPKVEEADEVGKLQIKLELSRKVQHQFGGKDSGLEIRPIAEAYNIIFKGRKQPVKTWNSCGPCVASQVKQVIAYIPDLEASIMRMDGIVPEVKAPRRDLYHGSMVFIATRAGVKQGYVKGERDGNVDIQFGMGRVARFETFPREQVYLRKPLAEQHDFLKPEPEAQEEPKAAPAEIQPEAKAEAPKEQPEEKAPEPEAEKPRPEIKSKYKTLKGRKLGDEASTKSGDTGIILAFPTRSKAVIDFDGELRTVAVKTLKPIK